jgi:predicted nucleotidyltransferase
VNRAEVIARLKTAEPELRARGVAALYLYGSYARDEARPDSDVDVLVEPANDNFFSLESYMGAYFDLQKAVGGREVGYTTRDALSRYVRPYADQDAIRIF